MIATDQERADTVADRLRKNWRARLIADNDYVRRPKESFFAESRRHVDDYITQRLDELLAEREQTPA